MRNSKTLVLFCLFISSISFGQASQEKVEEFLLSVNCAEIINAGFEIVVGDKPGLPKS